MNFAAASPNTVVILEIPDREEDSTDRATENRVLDRLRDLGRKWEVRVFKFAS